MADIIADIYKSATELVEVASAEGITFGFAESLTGGMISKSVVDVPGASRSFKGSVVSYTNEVKENVLGVPSEIIDTHTEVSSECASAMAAGVARVIGVDLAISVTGIAGPSGDMPGKPVGTVFMGYFFSKTGANGALELHFSGDRDSIRTCTTLAAIDLAKKLIKDGKA